MSELTLFKGGVPDFMKGVGADDVTNALAGNAQRGARRISIKGGVFREFIGGKEHRVSEERSMNVVIIKAAPHVSRTYYSGSYSEGEAVRPTCWSSDSQKPDASVKDKQSNTCLNCPQNIKGSGQGDSRACRYQQRLAVLLADDIEGDVFQLVLPSKSIFGKGDNDKMPFQQYAKYVGSQGKSLSTLVTEIRMDSDSDTPKLTFKPVRFLTRDEWNVARDHDRTVEHAVVIEVAESTLQSLT